MITAAVIAVIAVVVLLLFSWSPELGGVEWKEKEESAGGLRIVLKDRSVIISKNGEVGYKMSPEFKAEDMLIKDIDGDGVQEMTVLVWKRGKYGPAKPFWVEEDEKEYSQHIFIYELEDDGTASSKWFASELGMVVRRMKYTDNKRPVLILEDTEGNSSAWIWDSFGMKNIENRVDMLAFGDNIIHKELIDYAGSHENGSYDYLYESMKDEIEKADIAAVNAETVLVDKESAVSGYPQFGSPIGVGEALADAGFDLVSCANNHALDKGMYGIRVSSGFYKNAGITFVGIQDPEEDEYEPYKCISKNGISFAVFSYTQHTNGMDARDKYPYAVHYFPEEDELSDEIARGAEAADFVIVFAHWGEEYMDEPDEYQKRYAQIMADAGADVIIGTHPHVIQPAEIIKGRNGNETLVCYSLGNFVAMPSRDERSRVGAKLEMTIERGIDRAVLKDWKMSEIRVQYTY